MKYIEVVAAVFKDENNNIFCARRKDEGELALKWEFPGGKIEENENHVEALIREIDEELNTEIIVKDYIMTVNHQYNFFHLTMHAYNVDIVKGHLRLNEHTDSKWLKKDDLMELDWAAADIPIVKKLKIGRASCRERV